jgi:cysteine desulfurase
MEVYFDHAAATPVDPKVQEAILPFFSDAYGNPGSLHTKGKQAKEAVEQSRKTIAKFINATPAEVIFTGSGTESCNLGLIGATLAQPEKKHVVITATEHQAILEPALFLKNWGYEVTILPVNEYGQVTPQQVVEAVREETVLVSIIWGNNEIGSINPLKEITRAVKKQQPEVLVHTDACQVMGDRKVDVQSLGVDLLSFSAAKIYGPKGVAVLYKRQGVKIAPLVLGGGQEHGLHAGTQNVPGIIGMAKAVELVDYKELAELREYFIAELEQAFPEAKLNGHATERLANNISITLPGVEGEAVVIYLDKAGIAASTGSACTTSQKGPSHVIKALGYNDTLALGTVRFTLGKDSTKEEVDYAVGELKRIVDLLKK